MDGEARKKARAPRGASRQDEARQHIQEIDTNFAGEVARSAKELKHYDGIPKTETEGRVPAVSVRDQDTVSCVLELGRGLASACDLTVLDFASFVSPGGEYDRGGWAQEEALCAESTLFNVLRGERAWYGANRRRYINCDLYRNRALAVPKVRFERERYHSYADVIVCAAPDAARARANYHVDDETLRKAMRGRIRLVCSIADDLGHDRVVLGAFGCGVFGWDASVVAELFRSELASGKHAFSEVIFAIPSDRRNNNLSRFEHAFKTFPEENPDPWKPPVKKTQKPVTRPHEQDDDWRQYL